ncbi:hypothetical protein Hthe01_08490 [Hydrogenophilus thermoluteolus]|nr:hypothetical protein [Hydrogenophilus thermoluteolus]GLW60500.1 hypothetical protein Hthe01_08490 [Hydrogenophilus thermoluteolus]
MFVMKKFVTVAVLSLSAALVYAHDPSQHHAVTDREKPDCSMMQQMHSGSDRDDPVVQAMIARCAEMMKEEHREMMMPHGMQGAMPQNGMMGHGSGEMKSNHHQ